MWDQLRAHCWGDFCGAICRGAALRHCTRRFSGVTGDVFGAMAETAAAAAALVVPSLD